MFSAKSNLCKKDTQSQAKMQMIFSILHLRLQFVCCLACRNENIGFTSLWCINNITLLVLTKHILRILPLSVH